jgi:hypothetical protein
MSTILSLEQIAKNKKWIPYIQKRMDFIRLNPDEISVRFAKNKKFLAHANRVYVSFGVNVIKKLKWKLGDKINVFFHPDDIFSIMLTKSTSGDGRTLHAQNKSSRMVSIIFTWSNPIMIQVKKATVMDYLLINDNNAIVTRID